MSGFWGKLSFAFLAGIVFLKLAAWFAPQPHLGEVWLGTQCPGGKVVLVLEIDEPELRACKDIELRRL